MRLSIIGDMLYVSRRKLNNHVLKYMGLKEQKNEIFQHSNQDSNIQLPNGELGLSL